MWACLRGQETSRPPRPESAAGCRSTSRINRQAPLFGTGVDACWLRVEVPIATEAAAWSSAYRHDQKRDAVDLDRDAGLREESGEPVADELVVARLLRRTYLHA